MKAMLVLVPFLLVTTMPPAGASHLECYQASRLVALSPTVTSDDTPAVRVEYHFPDGACTDAAIRFDVIVDWNSNGQYVAHSESWTSSSVVLQGDVATPLADGAHTLTVIFWEASGSGVAPSYSFRVAQGQTTFLQSGTITLLPASDVPVEDQHAGTLALEDAGAFYCAAYYATGGGRTELACVNRALLAAVDGSLPRTSFPLLVNAPQGTAGVHLAVDLIGVSDPGRLFVAGSVAGNPVVLPFDPTDPDWFVENGDDVGLILRVTTFGEVYRAEEIVIPWAGQVLAAT